MTPNLKWFRADLHIHTCLSPCSELTMSPKRIGKKAKAKKLDIIAITDHNTAENTQASISSAGKNLTVIPGMEITSKEEVHVIGLFDDIKQAMTMQNLVYASLPEGINNPEIFGEQLIVNEKDEIEGVNTRLLINATQLKLMALIDAIHTRKGLAIAAHVDRPAYGVIAQLGFIPDDLEFDALEISANSTPESVKKQNPETSRFPFIRSSDAHNLDMLGQGTTYFYLAKPTIDEIKKALFGQEGRKTRIA